MGAGIDLASAGCNDAELTCPRSVSEYLSVLPHGPLVFAGPLPFGFGPALGAHSPPLNSLRRGCAQAQIFRRLCVKHISCHSADTFSSPRNRNLRIPRADLSWPNTASRGHGFAGSDRVSS